MKRLSIGMFLAFSIPVFADAPKVAVSGCSVEGHIYADEVSCKDVRQLGRPFRSIPAPFQSDPNDLRLQDAAFMQELSWVTEQVRSCGCACCHDTQRSSDYALWDINKPYIWTDQLTKRGVVILGGQLSSGTFGSIPASENNGFDRTQTGAPTTDTERFKSYFKKEVERRGITAEDIAKMRPL